MADDGGLKYFDHSDVEALYEETGDVVANIGQETIHAKRMPGRFRSLKNYTRLVWLVFFLGPYVRWQGHQAILFDLPNRQFHFFGTVIMPQDFWMLTCTLLFFAILLALATTISGRVFCGYFCFQTVWTDVYTWIEEKVEGNPLKQKKLKSQPWSLGKVRKKAVKHFFWLIIAMLTGVSFTAWFIDVYDLWAAYFTLSAPLIAWVLLGMFTAGTYVFAGFMREQVCLWLCPYARIQGVMVDHHTVVPTYDIKRGEPRGRLSKNDPEMKAQGDCIACNQCVAVCPTGVDIRKGQQLGCITCGLCIDACDSVMERVGRPKGLIRYASLAEMKHERYQAWYKRGRLWVYSTILLLALAAIASGFILRTPLHLNIVHSRQPLYVLLKDGSIQNKYTLKLLNKSTRVMPVNIKISGVPGATMVGVTNPIELPPTDVFPLVVFVKVPEDSLQGKMSAIVFEVQAAEDEGLYVKYESQFYGPK